MRFPACKVGQIDSPRSSAYVHRKLLKEVGKLARKTRSIRTFSAGRALARVMCEKGSTRGEKRKEAGTHREGAP
jgi:hypothetical protein